MTKKLLFVCVVVLAVALVAIAADAITGKWVYEQAGRQGGTPRQTTLDLKADGAKLTGSVIAPGRGGAEPQSTEISNGKVDGNNVSFEVVRETQMGKMVTKYEGSVAGSELKLKITSDMGRGPQTSEVVAKRAAN